MNSYNNSMFVIGDIKNSILPLPEFVNLQGDCWIQLNVDGVEDVDISGTDLSVVVGSSIKSTAGRFLRAAGGDSALLGGIQEDEFKSHRHTNTNQKASRTPEAGGLLWYAGQLHG